MAGWSPEPTVDDDGDGFSEHAGDCDDADDAVSPSAVESTADVSMTFSATSPCASLGELSSTLTFGDGSVGGGTAEDRFVGIVSAAGISSVTISAGGPLEIDHLQFGW